jgi:hypothetical protein
MRERGFTDDSLTPEMVEQVASGDWDPRLPQSLVLLAGVGPERIAWALSTPVPDGSVLDSVEAFLFLVGVLHAPGDELDAPSLLPFEDEDADDLDLGF